MKPSQEKAIGIAGIGALLFLLLGKKAQAQELAPSITPPMVLPSTLVQPTQSIIPTILPTSTEGALEILNNPVIRADIQQGVKMSLEALTETGVFSSVPQAAEVLAEAGVTGGLMVASIINSMFMGEIAGFTSPVARYTASVLNMLPIPMIGVVIGGFLEGWLGEQPKSPYRYYDPTTRGLKEGIQLGEPLDQFDSASRMWMDVVNGTYDRLAIQYAKKYGFDPNNLYDLSYGPEIYSELGVPIQGSVIGQYYKAGVMDYVYIELEKAGGLYALLNPVERRILINYDTLFLKEQTQTPTGGPSPYMVYMASLGR